MKFFVELFSEILATTIVLTYEAPLDIVGAFASFSVIGAIDEEYFGLVKSNLKERLEARDFELPIENSEIRKGYKHNFFDRVLLIICRMMFLFYEVLYFYLFAMNTFGFYIYIHGVGENSLNGFLQIYRPSV